MFCWKQRVSPSLLFSLWSYRTASTKKPVLSKQAQRAVWATKIIETIQKSRPQKCIYSPSLREKLINLTDPLPSYQFDPGVKEEVLKMFKEGIHLDNQAFRQERFMRARSAASSKLNTIFCPNYLVTQQMFQIVSKFHYLLVCGNFGISKTISLALYSILAQHVNIFYYQAGRQTADLKQEGKMLEKEGSQKGSLKNQILMLEQKNALKKVPRYWYWTINRTDIELKGWRSIQQSLIVQAHQLSTAKKEDLQKCSSLKEFISRLRYYYPESKVENRFIIDQINGLASLMRKWNEFLILKRVQIEKIRGLDEESRSLLQELIKQHQKEFYIPAKKLIGFFDEIKMLCNGGYILNSSINIEKTLIMDPKILPHQQLFPLKFQKFGLLSPLVLPILGNHENVNQIQMRYSENLRSNQGRNDFFHFFWFEVENFLKQKVPTQKLATAGRIFLSAAQTRQGRGYYCTLYIKEYLNKDFDSRTKDIKKLLNAIEQLPTFSDLNEASCREKLSELFPPETFSKMFPSAFKVEGAATALPALDSPQSTYKEHPLAAIFKEMFEQFDHHCLTQEKKKVNSFMKKGDYRKKLKFMAAIYCLAEFAAAKKRDLQFPMFLLDAFVGQNVAAHFLSEEHNQQLLPINRNLNSNEMVDFLWSPQQFLLLTTEAIYPQLYQLHASYFMSFFRQCNQIQPVFRGIVFQLLFLRQLNPKTVIIFKIFKGKNIFTELPTQISASMSFLPFNQYIVKQIQPAERQRLYYLHSKEQVLEKDLEQVIDVDLHFQDILTFCDKNQKQFASGVPYFKQQFVYNNKCVDFVLAQKRDQSYTIYTFDITVSKYTSDKISDAKAFLKSLVSIRGSMFEFHHIILCPKQVCRKKIFVDEDISNNLTIEFSSVDNFKMLNGTYPDEMYLLEVLQGTNEQLRNRLE